MTIQSDDYTNPYNHTSRVRGILSEFSIDPSQPKNSDPKDRNKAISELEKEITIAEGLGIAHKDIAYTCSIISSMATFNKDFKTGLAYAKKGLDYDNVSDCTKGALFLTQSTAYYGLDMPYDSVKSAHNAFVFLKLAGEEHYAKQAENQLWRIISRYKVKMYLPDLFDGGSNKFDIYFELHPRSEDTSIRIL